MKSLLTVLVFAVTSSLYAQAPEPLNGLRKTLTAASKEQKAAFILLGRASCGNCNATKRLIREGKITVPASEYVIADLNIDDAKTEADFMRKYSKESFGDTLPFVVITDPRGKALASRSGAKSSDNWNALLAEAKGKMKPNPAAAGAGAKSDWPFKTAAPK